MAISVCGEGGRVADEGGGAFKWGNNRISRVH